MSQTTARPPQRAAFLGILAFALLGGVRPGFPGSDQPARAEQAVNGDHRPSSSVEDGHEHRQSCASVSLYVLLKLRGRSVDVDAINEKMSPGEQGEVSMAVLEDVAAEFGIRLEGRRVTPEELLAVDAPFILLVEPSHLLPHGHFQTMRWLADNSALQIISPPDRPQFISTSQLMEEYDGPPLLILLPRPPIWTWRLLALIGGGVFFTALVCRRFAKRRVPTVITAT